jgi:hypothetical protein
LPWLQPGPPEEADRRDKTARGAHFFYVAHDRLPWCPRGGDFQQEQREIQGPLVQVPVASRLLLLLCHRNRLGSGLSAGAGAGCGVRGRRVPPGEGPRGRL